MPATFAIVPPIWLVTADATSDSAPSCTTCASCGERQAQHVVADPTSPGALSILARTRSIFYCVFWEFRKGLSERPFNKFALSCRSSKTASALRTSDLQIQPSTSAKCSANRAIKSWPNGMISEPKSQHSGRIGSEIILIRANLTGADFIRSQGQRRSQRLITSRRWLQSDQ